MTNFRKIPENLICIWFMTVAMAGFSIEDAVIKRLSQDMPISQVLVLIGCGGMSVFVFVSLLKRERLFTRSICSFWFIVRTISELFSAIFFVIAIVYASLSTASAILQATPIFVSLAATIFLKQRVRIRQWCFILLGLIGVICIIQPGMEGFQPASLYAILGVLFLVLRDTITRVSVLSIPAVTVSFWAFFALCMAGFTIIPIFDNFAPITSTHLWFLVLSAFSGSLAYYAIVLATSGGDVAIVSPFRYTRLLFALLIAVVFFDEQLNWMIYLGISLIVSSGILVLIQTNTN